MKSTPQSRPKSRNQAWTAQQVALLDQITIEISEAWSKDLENIRETHAVTLRKIKSCEILEDKMELFVAQAQSKLEQLSSDMRIEILQNMMEKLSFMIDELNTRFGILDKGLWDLSNKIDNLIFKNPEPIKKETGKGFFSEVLNLLKRKCKS